MRTTKTVASTCLLTLAALLVIAPAHAVRSGLAGTPTGKSTCGAIKIPNGKSLAAMLASGPPQGDIQGCCVIKSGDQNQWQYIYTTSQNCTQLARNANVSYSFYPNTDCGKVKPN